MIDNAWNKRYIDPKRGAKMKRKLLNVFLGLLITAAWVSVSWAGSLNLTYSLVEGGSVMQLEPKFLFKGVQLNMTANPATQYQVTQNIVRPLVNPTDNSTVGDKFVVRSIRQSNAYGDLLIPPSDPGMPVRSGQVLYINKTGQSDTMTLVYGISDTTNLSPGLYSGQISFTINPINSTTANVTQYVNITLRIEEKDMAPVIEISTPTRPGVIYLNSARETTKTSDVSVLIKAGLRGDFTIIQSLGQPIEAAGENKQLDPKAVNFQVLGASKGMGAPLTPLSNMQQIIYNAGPGGVMDREFAISYGLGDLSSQKAGRYRSTIRYYLQQPGKPTKLLETLVLEIEVGKIFDLTVKTALQTGKIEFNNLKFGDAKSYGVDIEVKSNIGRRYQVTQKVAHELVNKEGAVMPADNFTLITEGKDVKGTLKFPVKTPVKKGDTVLFISDDDGSSGKFSVTYELFVPRDAKLGDYSTSLSYSIAEI